MSAIKENFALLNYNTFQIPAFARFFTELADESSVEQLLHTDLIANHPFYILGGGSNILFTRDYEGLIIHPVIKGIEKIQESESTVLIRAGAGEDWDGFVEHCVNNEWGGIENLSWIPGMVGASPVQNIGAYGVEIMEFIETVVGYHIETGKKIHLTAKECLFSYRSSIFKNQLKDKVLITHVKFRLNKHHQYNTRYPELNKAMDEFPETSIQTIRQAVIQIRKNKLPDPKEIGNAGSFFKNPIVDAQQAKDLQQHFADLPVYIQSDGYCKLSAAWLIDRSGWKGKTSGKTGTHKRQPLIIINHGGATGNEILEFALKIQKAVAHQFGIRLEMEVNIL